MILIIYKLYNEDRTEKSDIDMNTTEEELRKYIQYIRIMHLRITMRYIFTIIF